MSYEIAVVGAGPAGLAAAIEAARRGRSVVVFERRTPPLDKACGEGLMPLGVCALGVLGVRALLDPADCVPIRGIRYIQEDGTSVEGLLPHGGGLGIRRLGLTRALLKRAGQLGVEPRFGQAVLKVDPDPTGVGVETTAGSFRFQALVIADGLGSPLRRQLGLERPAPGPRRYGMRQHFRIRPWTDFVEIHFEDGVEAYVTPAGTDRVGIAFLWDKRPGELVSMERFLKRFPRLLERVRDAPPDSQPRGAGPLRQDCTAVVRGRVALIGDAAGYVDAITGEGLSLAFASALAWGKTLSSLLGADGGDAALGAYRAFHRTEFKRYAWVTSAVLALARAVRLRRGMVRLLARAPRVFQAILSWVMAIRAQSLVEEIQQPMQTQAVAPPQAAPAPPAGEPPGPPGARFVGSLPQMRRDPLGFVTEAFRTYGDVVKIQLVYPAYLLSHPDHVRYVLQDNHLNYRKGFAYQRLRPMLGNGLLSSEGAFWRRQRRLMQPVFSHENIGSFADRMVQRCQETLEDWQRQGRLDLHRELSALTLVIVVDALFSLDVRRQAPRVGEALTAALRISIERLRSIVVWPKYVPTPTNVRFATAMRTLDRLMHTIITERRGSSRPGVDLLGRLLAARDPETGEAMDDEQLRDEVMTMVLAGHETTANALSWLFYLLALHPEVERKLHRHVSDVLGGRAPTLGDLSELDYVEQVVREAMRLYPPIWTVTRQAMREDVIGGYRIPEGGQVLLCTYTAHRHPALWQDPERFCPERFAEGGGAPLHRGAYFPFAAGPRQCIGNHFAMMEAAILVSLIVQRFHVQLEPGQQIRPEAGMTLRPFPALWVRLTRREPLEAPAQRPLAAGAQPYP